MTYPTLPSYSGIFFTSDEISNVENEFAAQICQVDKEEIQMKQYIYDEITK